jgi:hypothetical protein
MPLICDLGMKIMANRDKTPNAATPAATSKEVDAALISPEL